MSPPIYCDQLSWKPVRNGSSPSLIHEGPPRLLCLSCPFDTIPPSLQVPWVPPGIDYIRFRLSPSAVLQTCGSYSSEPVASVWSPLEPAPSPLLGPSVLWAPSHPAFVWGLSDSGWDHCILGPNNQTPHYVLASHSNMRSWKVHKWHHPDLGVNRGSLVCQLCGLGKLINLSDPHVPVNWGPWWLSASVIGKIKKMP